MKRLISQADRVGGYLWMIRAEFTFIRKDMAYERALEVGPFEEKSYIVGAVIIDQLKQRGSK